MGALRPRLDITLVMAGEQHLIVTTLRDSIDLKKHVANPTGDLEDVARLTWLACRRLGVFTEDFEAFVDAVEDIEVGEAAPLGTAAASPASSPPQPEPPASPPARSPA